MPSVCLDEDAIKDYQSDGTWFGYADQYRTQLLDIEEYGDKPVYYTSARDHIVHCAMLWKKQYRAFFKDGGRNALDQVLTDEGHTMHCAHYLINMTSWGTNFANMPIEVIPGYSGCWVKEK
jgi:hypothetical protein